MRKARLLVAQLLLQQGLGLCQAPILPAQRLCLHAAFGDLRHLQSNRQTCVYAVTRAVTAVRRLQSSLCIGCLTLSQRKMRYAAHKVPKS